MELERRDSGSVSSLRRQMDRLFDSFLGREFGGNGWAPALDELETPEEFIVKAELPGMNEDDISVTLSGNNLIIQGVRKSEQEEKNKHVYRMERSYGKFERVLPLPVSIDSNQVSAKYDKGLLEVHLPKKPEAYPQKISVKRN